MTLFPFGRKKEGIGLDIGHRWGKVIKLTQKGEMPVLERLGRTFWTKEEREDRQRLQERIKNILNALLLKEKEVITSLAGHSVIIKRIPLSEVGGVKDYDEVIKKQAKDHIPFDVKNVYLDYHIINDTPSPREYFLVASKKEEVHDLQEVLEGMGLKILIIDVDGFALCNCFEFNYPELINGCTYLLDIGSTSSIFCVYSKGNPLIIRDAGFGGDQVTFQIKEVLNCPFQEAEKIKTMGLKGIDPRDKLKISQKIKELYLSWVDEIQKLIYFHSSNYEGEEVTRLFLSGGGSLCAEIKKTLEEHLEKEVLLLNPFKKISVSIENFDPEYLKNISPQFVIATGLALRNIFN